MASIQPLASASDFWDEVKTPGLKNYNTHLKAAENALRSRHFPQAIEFSEQAIKKIGTRAQPHIIKALAQGELQLFADATESFTHALSLDPKSLDDPSRGARASHFLMKAKRFTMAKKVLERLVARLSPSSHRRDLYAIHGDLLMMEGPKNLKKAQKSYQTALRGGPHVRASLGLALSLDRSGKHDEALTMIRALPSDIRFVMSQLNLSPEESAARYALVSEGKEDPMAHQRWTQASKGPWMGHAEAAARRTQKMKKKKKSAKKKALRRGRPLTR